MVRDALRAPHHEDGICGGAAHSALILRGPLKAGVSKDGCKLVRPEIEADPARALRFCAFCSAKSTYPRSKIRPHNAAQAGPSEGASRGVVKRDRLAVADGMTIRGAKRTPRHRRPKPQGPVATGWRHRALGGSAVTPCQRPGAAEAL